MRLQSANRFTIWLFLLVTTPPMTTIAFVSLIHSQVQQQPIIAPKQQHVVYRRKNLELPYLVEEMEAPTMYTSPTFFDHDALDRIFDQRRLSSVASPSVDWRHVWGDVLTHGTKTHLYNAVLSLAIPLLLFGKMIPFLSSYLSGHPALLSVLILEGSFLGLVIDNMINASGKYVGEGLALRRLTRIRLALHGLSIPSCFIPVIELGKRAKLFSTRVSNIGMGIWLSYAVVEFIGWVFLYDINELKVVDNRNVDSCDHHPRYTKGTLAYTCGKIAKLVVPAAILQIFTIITGYRLWNLGVVAGPWLFASGALGMLSCSLQRPDIQAYGETVMLATMWAAVATVSSSVG